MRLVTWCYSHELHSLESLPLEEPVQPPIKTTTASCRWLSLGTHVSLLPIFLQLLDYCVLLPWQSHAVEVMIPRENASASADASEAPNTVTMTHQEQLVDFARQLDDIPNGVSLSTLLVQDARHRLVNNPSEPGDASDAGYAVDEGSRSFSHGTSMVDNRLGARYDDAKLDVKAGFARWRSEVTFRFPMHKLDAITYENERYDTHLGYMSVKYHRWYDTRRVMALSANALYLDMNLRDPFKRIEASSLLRDWMVAHFTRGDGVNPDII
ncbi:hypothetical protein GN958_ATG20266, partial [Phytophthora infestans]